MAEDILREAGYMLPQSGNTTACCSRFLITLLGRSSPKEAAERLLELLPDNDREKQEEKEEKIEKWRCTVCGYIHEGPLPEGFTCHAVNQPASVFYKSVKKELLKGNGGGMKKACRRSVNYSHGCSRIVL